MSKLKKNSLALVFVICLLCVFLCGSALAEETDNGVSYTETPVYVDGLLSCCLLYTSPSPRDRG